MRVLHNGRLLADTKNANLKVVELFCLLHDTKKKDSGVYKLLNFEADITLPTKGYDCDWSPLIGKIS